MTNGGAQSFLLSNPLEMGETLASAPCYMEVIFPIFLLFGIYCKHHLFAALLASTWLVACTLFTIIGLRKDVVQ